MSHLIDSRGYITIDNDTDYADVERALAIIARVDGRDRASRVRNATLRDMAKSGLAWNRNLHTRYWIGRSLKVANRKFTKKGIISKFQQVPWTRYFN